MKGRMAYMEKPGQISIREYDLPKKVEPGAALLEVIQSNVCGSENDLIRTIQVVYYLHVTDQVRFNWV